MQDVAVAAKWAGVNRLLSPHMLPESKSPDSQNAGPSADLEGVLGPRGGRYKAYYNATKINGVVGFALNDAIRYRLITLNDGTVTAVLISSWPSPITYAAAGGSYVPSTTTRIDLSKPSTTAPIGTTEVTYSLPAGDALVLKTNDVLLVNVNGVSINGAVGVTSARLNLRVELNGVWTTIFTFLANSAAGANEGNIIQVSVSGTGTSITRFRLQFVCAGVGDTVFALPQLTAYMVAGSEAPSALL